jgi:hypothetical protein
MVGNRSSDTFRSSHGKQVLSFGNVSFWETEIINNSKVEVITELLLECRLYLKKLFFLEHARIFVSVSLRVSGRESMPRGTSNTLSSPLRLT